MANDEVCCLSYLPDDLTLKILLRLPAKSLIRFKSVCRNWNSIITNPKFAKSHLQISKQFDDQSSHIFFRNNSAYAVHLDLNYILSNPEKTNIESKFVPMPFKSFDSKVDGHNIIGSCNGIICIKLYHLGKLCLWNPTIDETRFIKLPLLRENVIILFDAFGYAPSIDDYKIVLVIQKTTSTTSTRVYSLRHSKWSELKDDYHWTIPGLCVYGNKFPHHKYNMKHIDAVVLNDSLHWIMGQSYDDSYEDYFILKFDLVNERFEKVAYLNQICNVINETYMKQMEISVTQDNKLGVYQLYNQTVLHNRGAQKWVLLDRIDDFSELKFQLEGRWHGIDVGYELRKISCNGNVLIFEDMGAKGQLYYHENIYGHYRAIHKLVIFDLRQGQGQGQGIQQPLFIEVINDYRPSYYIGSPFPLAVNYVPSLISPNNAF